MSREELSALNTTAVTKRLASSRPDRRRNLALAFVNRDVELTYGRYEELTLRGRILSVAAPTFGTAADLLIIRPDGPRYDRAVSLAEVRTIRTVEHEKV